jgi:hypothetical protein
MLPKFRSFVRPIIRSFVRSFIVPIHHSSFVHTNYSPSLFIVTIHHRYYSSMISIINFSSSLLIVTIHCSSDHPKISTTHPSCCPVHLRPARPISQSHELRWLWFSFQWELPIWSPILGFSKLSMLTLRFLRTRLPNSDSNNSCF